MSSKEAGTNARHKHGYEFRDYCGAYVCDCGDHKGLARCYCGFSRSGNDGRRELIEMGETIGDESDTVELLLTFDNEDEAQNLLDNLAESVEVQVRLDEAADDLERGI